MGRRHRATHLLSTGLSTISRTGQLAGSAVGLQDRGRGPPAVGAGAPTSHVSAGRTAARVSSGWLSPCGEGQPRCHGPGAEGAWPAALPARSLAARALPQPDRLGHLLSRSRGDDGWRGRRARPPSRWEPPGAREDSWDEFAGRARFRALASGGPACAGLSGPDTDGRRSRGITGFEPRAASPGPSRKRPGSAAPEVPSIDEIACVRAVSGASRAGRRLFRPRMAPLP